MNSQNSNHIVDYWFGDLIKDPDFSMQTEVFKKHRHIWNEKDPEIDLEIKNLFSNLLSDLKRMKVEDFPRNSELRLASVIVLDQFSRHIFRGNAEMYAADDLAQEIVRDSIKHGFDSKLPLIARMFLYMPLMHSENIVDHETTVSLFENLKNEAQKSNFLSAPFFVGSLGHAVKHRDVVALFGRYPHRNEILNRKSSAVEMEYLLNNPPLF